MTTTLRFSVILTAALLLGSFAQAQQEKKKERRKKSVTVVTTNDGDSTEKTTIVVDGENVTINGKPASEYKGGNVRVITNGDHFTYTTPGMVWEAPRAPRAPRASRAPRAPMAIAGTHGNVFTWNSNAAFLGVSTEDGEGGAKVTGVTKDGAAQKAGLKEGDVITKVNDYNVADADDLPMAIGKFKPEDKVTVHFKRDGKEQTATATLQKNKEARSFAIPGQAFNFDFDQSGFRFFGKPRLGVQIEGLAEGKGVKVLDVDEDTPAAKAGLQKDDVITDFNGKSITSVDDVRNAMADVKQGETVKVTYKRGGSSHDAEIKFHKPVKKANL